MLEALRRPGGRGTRLGRAHPGFAEFGVQNPLGRDDGGHPRDGHRLYEHLKELLSGDTRKERPAEGFRQRFRAAVGGENRHRGRLQKIRESVVERRAFGHVVFEESLENGFQNRNEPRRRSLGRTDGGAESGQSARKAREGKTEFREIASLHARHSISQKRWMSTRCAACSG